MKMLCIKIFIAQNKLKKFSLIPKTDITNHFSSKIEKISWLHSQISLIPKTDITNHFSSKIETISWLYSQKSLIPKTDIINPFSSKIFL